MSYTSRSWPWHRGRHARCRLGKLGALTMCAVGLAACNVQQGLDSRGDIGQSQIVVAPELNATTIGGGHFDLASQRGHVVVIDFWGSWCGPCRVQQPELDAVAQTYAGRVTFIGVDLRDNDAAALAYVSEFGVPYPSVSDPSGDITNRFDVPAPPTTLVVDADGKIVFRRLGGMTRGVLRPMLDRLIAQKSTPSAR